ncbi:hypothetical protein D3C76_758880 [compost metagenome]
MGQLVALGQAGGAQRVTFGQQAARRVDHHLPAVSVIAVHHEFLGAAFRTETQAFVGQQFVMGKAVMQLTDADVFGTDAGFFVDFSASLTGHAHADDADQRPRLESFRLVGDQRLGEDADIGTQAVLLGEAFGNQNGCRTAAGRRARHQSGHDAGENHLVGHDFFGRQYLLEHRQRVVGAMTAGLGANSGEGFHLRAVFLHVLFTRAAEEFQGVRHFTAFRKDRIGHVMALAIGNRAIKPMGFQGTGLHLLETERQGAIHGAAFHGLARQVKRGRTAAAVVVDVDHRNPGQAHFIKR